MRKLMITALLIGIAGTVFAEEMRHGQGPFAITYVNPGDDPRQK